jgi:hypothetical protein
MPEISKVKVLFAAGSFSSCAFKDGRKTEKPMATIATHGVNLHLVQFIERSPDSACAAGS